MLAGNQTESKLVWREGVPISRSNSVFMGSSVRDFESGLHMMRTSNRPPCEAEYLKASDDSNAFQTKFFYQPFSYYTIRDLVNGHEHPYGVHLMCKIMEVCRTCRLGMK